jgi:hypothetical protein
MELELGWLASSSPRRKRLDQSILGLAPDLPRTSIASVFQSPLSTPRVAGLAMLQPNMDGNTRNGGDVENRDDNEIRNDTSRESSFGGSLVLSLAGHLVQLDL